MAGRGPEDDLRHAAWARRHPALAQDERCLRKARAAALARWKHKRQGTPETHDHASRTRQGALARLHLSGAIDADQLAHGAQIALVAARIAADVTVRTASLETRIDTSRHGDGFFEALGAVRAEIAYSRWRAALGTRAPMVLAIVVHDTGLARAAADHHMHARRARAVLIAALDHWGAAYAEARRAVDQDDLISVHAQLLR